ncbi:MAG: hypothetical protein KKA97_10595 [Actinobacteria bacterium]|nr:hypothetical protein [Actinomycetota bacterium]
MKSERQTASRALADALSALTSRERDVFWADPLSSARSSVRAAVNAMRAPAEAGALIVSNAEFEYYVHK